MPLIRICQGLFDPWSNKRHGRCWQVFYRTTAGVAMGSRKHI
jgi:hypothetical protein